MLTAAQPGAQHPHRHNQGPSPALLGLRGQLDLQTDNPSWDHASPALSTLMGQILPSSGSQRGSTSFSPSWMRAQEFGVSMSVFGLGQGHTHCKCKPGQGMLLPPASPNWDVLEAVLQPPPSHQHRGRDRGVMSQSVPPCHAVCPQAQRALSGYVPCVFFLQSLPSRRQLCIWSLPGSELPVPALSVSRRSRGWPRGVEAAGAAQTLQDGSAGCQHRASPRAGTKPPEPLLRSLHDK